MNFILKLLALFKVVPEVKKGSTRFVWIFHEYGFVLKFPLFSVKSFLKSFWKWRKNLKQFKKLFFRSSRFVGVHVPFSIEGVISNWQEYCFYNENRTQPFILPVYFSFFGVCNIMPIGQLICSEMDRITGMRFMLKIFRSATPLNADMHHFSNSQNFCNYGGHLCILDYGDSLTQEIIRKYWENLSALTTESVLG